MSSARQCLSFVLGLCSVLLGCVIHRQLPYLPYSLIGGILGCALGAISYATERPSSKGTLGSLVDTAGFVMGILGFLLCFHTVFFAVLRLTDVESPWMGPRY